MDSSSVASTEGTSIFSLIEMLFLLNVAAVLYLNLVALPISMIIILPSCCCLFIPQYGYW